MPELWASTRGGIDVLEKIHATRAQWTKAADSKKEITTLAQLREATAVIGSPGNAVEQQRWDEHLNELYRTSRSVVLFSWEEDVNAIVFFDAGNRPKYVYR